MTTGCGEVAGQNLLPPLSVQSIGPSPILPGTSVVIRGSGFVPTEVAQLLVSFVGDVAGHPVQIALSPERVSDTEIRVPVSTATAAVLIPTAGTLIGHVSVTRTPVFEGEVETRALSFSMPVGRELTPFINSITPTIFRPGDTLTIAGTDFLYWSEGSSVVILDGTFTTDSPPSKLPVEGIEIATQPPSPTDRDQLSLRVSASLFGVRPGTFVGSLTVRNEPSQGASALSESLEPGALRLEAATLESVSPLEASRGQRIVFHGAGLLPADPYEGSGTIFLLEGSLDADRGPTLNFTADSPLGVFPDDQPGPERAEVVLRVVEDEDGLPTGLGAVSGLFEGQVSPMLFHGTERFVGEALPLSFRVLPARQMVHLQFLPTFDDALIAFGLVAGRDLVIARILSVVARDYEGVNIVFAAQAPPDFDEYMIVEIGGEDPNGTGLFGLDNTAGKDTGNRRFDDVIGGFNADTRARGFAAYGGIFVTELLNLSPSLGQSPLADARFDTIFEPFCPDLGGGPASPAEAQGLGARAVAVAEAIRILGNLVASTITHEVGHALGLAAQAGAFHNTGDNPGWIMDAGAHRPFGERAELAGEGPAVFSPANRTYLEEVLPP
jgi:hypothetical protein